MEDRKPFNESNDEMEDSTKDNDDCEEAFQGKSAESGSNPTTLGNQVLPSFKQDASENQQLPFSLSAETSSRSSVPTSESSSTALDIDLLDERVSGKDVFCSSRTLRLRTNCSRSVDALLSPRQNPTDSSMPVLEHSGVDSAENIRRDRSILGETRNTDSASLPQPTSDRVTRSFLKARVRQETPPSLEKQSVEPSMEPTSAKKRRTQTSESDSSKSGGENKSSKLSSSASARTPDKSLGVQTRQMRAAAQEIESPQSLTRSLTPSKNKRKIIESSCSDSKTAKLAFESNLRFPTSADNIDHKSPNNLKTQDREVAERNLGMSESANEGKTSISFPDYSSDSNSLEQSSNPGDLHQDSSLINFTTDEDGTSMHSNTSTDASSASLDKESGKRRKESSASDTWFVQQHDSPEKAPILLTLKRTPTVEASSSTKDCETSMEVKPHEFPLVSSEETKSTSNMTHPATEIQMLESSQSRSTIQNSDLSSSPSRVLDCVIEARGFKTSTSSRPEQSSSSDIEDPSRALEFKTRDLKEGTDGNGSDSATRTSEPDVESKSKLSSICRTLERLAIAEKMLRSRNLPELQDPETQENLSESLLQRQHSGSTSRGASTSRERPEVGMGWDPPRLHVYEEQSASSHQPVITDGSSAGDGCISSSGRAMTTTTSAARISKYASGAQDHLLKILEEMMELNEDMDQYRRFKELFISISEFPSFMTESGLECILMGYVNERRRTFEAQNKLTSREITLEYHTKEVYEILIRIVVTALKSTMSVQSNRNFDTIIATYKDLKELYEKFTLFSSKNDAKDIKDEASRNLVEFLTGKIHDLLLLTRNAFRVLLMYIGEHADQSIINTLQEQLFEEDKSYLRRRTY